MSRGFICSSKADLYDEVIISKIRRWRIDLCGNENPVSEEHHLVSLVLLCLKFRRIITLTSSIVFVSFQRPMFGSTLNFTDVQIPLLVTYNIQKSRVSHSERKRSSKMGGQQLAISATTPAQTDMSHSPHYVNMNLGFASSPKSASESAPTSASRIPF